MPPRLGGLLLRRLPQKWRGHTVIGNRKRDVKVLPLRFRRRPRGRQGQDTGDLANLCVRIYPCEDRQAPRARLPDLTLRCFPPALEHLGCISGMRGMRTDQVTAEIGRVEPRYEEARLGKQNLDMPLVDSA